MMCAATAGARSRRVLLVDHYGKVGEKIRISGGGRCNFTNLHATHRDFLSRNPDFCRSALARYTPRDFLALVERHGIAYHEKTLGQLFCDAAPRHHRHDGGRMPSGGRGMVAALRGARRVAREDGAFVVDTDRGAVRAASLVIATGGLTVPKIGATPFAYRVAEQFGLAGGAAEARAGAAHLRCGAARALWRPRGRFARRRGVVRGRDDSARPCSSPTAACRVPRSSRSPLIGRRPAQRSRSTSNLLPGVDARAWLASERRSPRLPATSSRSAFPAASRSRGAKRTDSRSPSRKCPIAQIEAAGARARRLARAAQRHPGLQQGGSHPGRRRHAGALIEDDGGARGAGALLHRRGAST